MKPLMLLYNIRLKLANIFLSHIHHGHGKEIERVKANEITKQWHKLDSLCIRKIKFWGFFLYLFFSFVLLVLKEFKFNL